jgi:hypothetical protein
MRLNGNDEVVSLALVDKQEEIEEDESDESAPEAVIPAAK